MNRRSGLALRLCPASYLCKAKCLPSRCGRCIRHRRRSLAALRVMRSLAEPAFADPIEAILALSVTPRRQSAVLLRYPAVASPCLLPADRCHSRSSLHPPQAAVASLPQKPEIIPDRPGVTGIKRGSDASGKVGGETPRAQATSDPISNAADY